MASAASKLLDVVSQKSAPLSIVFVHMIQDCGTPFRQSLQSEREHRHSLLGVGVGAGLVFALHLPAHGLFLAGVPALLAAALLVTPFRWSSQSKPSSRRGEGTTSFTLWAVGLPVATYLAVELSWLLLFFLLDPSYPWFLFYTRPHA